MNAEDAILGGWTQRDRLAAKRAAKAQPATFEADVAFLVGLSDMPFSVLNRRQALRVRPIARSIAFARGCHTDRLMRPTMVVDVPPLVEGALALVEVRQAIERDLGLHRSMQALVLALRLRMQNAPVGHPNAQSHQPYREGGKPPTTAISPRPAIVHEHGIGQSVAPEHRHQTLARWAILLVATGLCTHRIARVVIDHGERVAATAARHGKVALEVHLPEFVGSLALEPLIGAGMLMRPLLQLPVPPQYLGDRARRRHHSRSLVMHHLCDLAAAPRVVALLANAQHLGFRRLDRLPRAAMRSARAIHQPLAPFRQIAPHPLVPAATRNAKAPAQLPHVRPWSQGQLHKFLALISHGKLPPRHRKRPPHRISQRSGECPRCLRTGVKSVLDVPGPNRERGGVRALRLSTARYPPHPHPLPKRGEGVRPRQAAPWCINSTGICSGRELHCRPLRPACSQPQPLAPRPRSRTSTKTGTSTFTSASAWAASMTSTPGCWRASWVGTFRGIQTLFRGK